MLPLSTAGGSLFFGSRIWTWIPASRRVKRGVMMSKTVAPHWEHKYSLLLDQLASSIKSKWGAAATDQKIDLLLLLLLVVVLWFFRWARG